MPRFRITIRRTMALVAIAAVALWTERMRQVANRYSALAQEYGFDYAIADLIDDDPAADHYRKLTDKYRHAARFPWLAVTPDPPEPLPGLHRSDSESKKPPANPSLPQVFPDW